MTVSRQGFDEFCETLAFSPLPGNDQEAFGVPKRRTTDFFVPPVLLEKLSNPTAAVTLISARGAAGKSTTATETATRLGAPLWKLEKDQAVGGTSFEYMLVKYLGSHDVTSRLPTSPPALVVVDSLDEARSRVSGKSWEEFVSSLATWAKKGLRFVLLGRERTIEDVWVMLEEGGVEVAWWEISHFAPQQCVDYIDQVVAKRDSDADRTSAEYRGARDALIHALRASAAGRYGEEFVGYAPVLDAAAAMLIGKPNLLAIRQRFEQQLQETSDLVDLLETILARLLERDQTKLEPLARTLKLEPGQAYRPEEQILWLCHFLEEGDVPSLPYLTSAEARQEYIRKVTEFSGDHPFRTEHGWASPIFEAYVASKVFDAGCLSPSRLVEIGHQSGFLFDFMNRHDSLVLTEAQFAALHASLIASEWSESAASAGLAQAAGDDHYTGSLSTSAASRLTEFALLPEQARTLRLLGPLSELSVHSRGTVVLQGTEIGPDLFVHAAEIVVEAESLDFARRPAGNTDDEPSVVLEATDRLELHAGSEHLPRASELELRVPGGFKLAYPWYEYRAELPEKEELDQKVIRFLNKIMSLTRNHGHDGERGVFIKKLEGRQPFPPEQFNRALGVLVSEGVVHIEGNMVFLRANWEPYRYSGKALPGQQQLDDVRQVWGPVLKRVQEAL
ncbi:hypothetical protein [Amycolatopsis sp. NPDC003861]